MGIGGCEEQPRLIVGETVRFTCMKLLNNGYLYLGLRETIQHDTQHDKNIAIQHP